MENTKTVKNIFSDAFAHGSGKPGIFVSFWGQNREITQEEKDNALIEYNRLKQEKIDSLQPGTLVFVGMGCDNDTDIGNYRIRTEIQRKDGKKFFVELSSNNFGMFPDFTIDRDLQIEYEKQFEKVRSIDRQNRTAQDKANYEKYSHQPYYFYRIEQAREFLKDKPQTKKTVLDFVNYIFETDFQNVEVENYLLTTNDYTSKE